MTRQETENFDFIKQKVFMHIYRQDNRFSKELEFFEKLEDNYDAENYKSAKLEVRNLMSNYSMNNIILKAKLFKTNHLPFFKGIPNSCRYRNDDKNMYFCLMDFEKQNFKFVNGVIKEQLLHKKYYKEIKNNLEDADKVDFQTLFNSYITLKSIIMLQSLMDRRIDSFQQYISDFSVNYNYKKCDTIGFTLEQLELYFDTINNKKEEKKVKSLRY